jgi:AsmA family protein
MRTVLKWTGIALGLLMVGIVVLVLVFDWNWIKGYVARKASEALGRTVVIEGDLDVELSWSPLVHINHLRLANASWSPEPSMLTLQRLTFRLDLRELLRGHLVLPTVELVQPVLRLEMSEQGLPNWTFGQAHPAGNSPTNIALPIIEQLHLREGHFTFFDYSSHTEITATLAEARATTMNPERRLQVEGAGQLLTMPLQFTLYGGTLQDLSANRPSPLQVQLVMHPWQVDLNGTIAQPLQLQGVAAEVSLVRLAPDQPSDQHGPAARSQVPCQLAGHLTQEGDVWAVRELAGTLGTSDVRGNVFLEMQEKRPLVRAELFSRHLDVRDLQTFCGTAGPPIPPAAAQTPGDNIPSATTIDLELTRVVNVQLHFEGQTVMMANQTLHNVSTDLVLHDGRLTLTPVFRLAGGTTRAQIEIQDRGEAPLHMTIRTEMAHVNVQQVFAALGMESMATGSVDGHIDVATSGRSLPELLSSLAGKAAFTVRDQARNTDFQVRVATEGGTQPTPPRLRLAGQGRVHGEPFHLEGRGGAWGSGQQPSPVQVQLRLGETRARIDGTLTQGPQIGGLAARVAIQGPDPARLSSFLPISIPSLPAYRLEGRLLRNGSTWTLKELKGSIGDSDLAGELSLDTDGKRLVLHGELHSQIFVVDELTGYAPEKKPGRVEPEKVQVPAQVQEQVQERPQAIEVTLRFRSNKVVVAKVPLEQFSTDLQLHNDRLALTPTFHLAGGTVQAQAQVETQANPLQSTVHITMHQLNLQQFLAWLELRPEDAAKLKTVDKPEAAAKPEATAKPETTGKPEMARKAEVVDKLGTAGKLDGQIALTGTGHSLADFLASANGNVLLSMREGQLGRVLIELVGLDVAETIQKALAREKAYQLRCLVADFAVHNGRMETQMLLVDTTDTKVMGGGFIDLRAKMLGLKLEPKAKDFSLFSAQAPLYITGPLAKLSAGPKLGELLLSLSMPVKLGTPENADCQAVLEASQRRYQSSKP